MHRMEVYIYPQGPASAFTEQLEEDGGRKGGGSKRKGSKEKLSKDGGDTKGDL